MPHGILSMKCTGVCRVNCTFGTNPFSLPRRFSTSALSRVSASPLHDCLHAQSPTEMNQARYFRQPCLFHAHSYIRSEKSTQEGCTEHASSLQPKPPNQKKHNKKTLKEIHKTKSTNQLRFEIWTRCANTTYFLVGCLHPSNPE